MYEFFVIVGAIIVAQVGLAVVMSALLFNKRFTKWYAKKVFKMTKSIEDEMFELEWEDGKL